jgi:hypothetical protein
MLHLAKVSNPSTLVGPVSMGTRIGDVSMEIYPINPPPRVGVDEEA